MSNAFLVGTNLYLRPLERADAPRVTPWLNDPEVRRTLAVHRPINLQSEEEFIAKVYQSEHDLVLGIVLNEGDTFIGVTGLHQMDFTNRHASFGIALGNKSVWNHGYGTEATALMVQYAFDTLNMNRVWLRVFEYNVAGIKTYEKVGFQREGVLRQEVYREGRYWDAIVMAILRGEWEGKRA